MLYMTELTHGPDTCITAPNEYAQLRARLIAGIKELAAEQGAEIVNGWSFPAGHRMWYVVEAPDSHTVASVFRDARTHHWNTVSIDPVIDFAEFKETVLGPLIGGA